jgi:hypothetical protein
VRFALAAGKRWDRPTAEWISHQLTEAYGWKVAPRYIIRDRDAVYAEVFIRRLRAMSIRDRPTAPRSPWQNGYCERGIGSIRRDCLDHVVVFGERHLRHAAVLCGLLQPGPDAPIASARMLRCRVPSMPRAVLDPGHFSVDFTISTSELDFRQAQGTGRDGSHLEAFVVTAGLNAAPTRDSRRNTSCRQVAIRRDFRALKSLLHSNNSLFC